MGGVVGGVVTKLRWYGAAGGGQYVSAGVGERCRHVGVQDGSVKGGEWEHCEDFCYWKTPLMEMAGKTMGIVGFGRIGQRTGAIAQAMGMKVVAYDHFRRPELETENCHYVSMEQLLSQSDIISLHCPLLPETKRMIYQGTIGQMKAGCLITNN